MTKGKTVAIIQARIGSTRLPDKVLKSILGKPMLWHIVQRVKRAKLIDKIVVATSTSPDDKRIIQFCKKNKIPYFAGSENDVLDRYYHAAKKFDAQIVVRITGDCPLIDPEIIDETIRNFTKENYDYVAIATGAGVINEKIKKFPDGFDCEVFLFKVLETTYKLAKTPVEREHPTMLIWKNSKRFKLGRLTSKKDYSSLRFTVDYPTDLEFVRKIYQKLYNKNPFFSFGEIISLINENPKILSINQQNIGKEGYEKLWQ